MALHDPTPVTEQQNDQLVQFVVARSEAVENDILAGRTSTVQAVAELARGERGDFNLRCDEDEARALVRAATLGGSALVGTRIAGVVAHALYSYVLPLAQQDLAEMECGQ